MEKWLIVSTGPDANGSSVTRVLVEFPPGFDQRHYPELVGITWRFHSDGGQPDEVTIAAMSGFEDRIADLGMRLGESILVQVATGNGAREWLHYVRDRDSFMAHFNRMLMGHPRVPIAIAFYRDPEWRVWHQLYDVVSPMN